MNLSGIFGLILALVTIAGAILMGGNPGIFINIPSAIFLFFAACGLEVMASGLEDFRHALGRVRVLVLRVSPDALRRQDIETLRHFAGRLYCAGIAGTIIGLIQMLASLDDPAKIGGGVAVAMLTTTYAFFTAEIIVRPAAQRIAFLLSEDEAA
jgi:flagellar motor component MotA